MPSGSRVIDHTPPDAPEGDGGGGGWAFLVTALGAIEAELVRGVLEANGVVPVVLDRRDPSPGAWMFLSGDPNAPVRIYVPRSLLEAGRLALMEVDLAQPEQEQPEARGVPAWWWIVATGLVLAMMLLSAARNAGML